MCHALKLSIMIIGNVFSDCIGEITHLSSHSGCRSSICQRKFLKKRQHYDQLFLLPFTSQRWIFQCFLWKQAASTLQCGLPLKLSQPASTHFKTIAEHDSKRDMPDPTGISLTPRCLTTSLNLWQQWCDSTPCIWQWSKSQPSTVFWPAVLFHLPPDGEFGQWK